MMNKLNSYKNTSISEEKNVSNKTSASNQIVGVENSSFNYVNDKKYDRDYKNSIVTFQLAKANEVVPNVQNVVSTVSLGIQLDLKRNCFEGKKCRIQPQKIRSGDNENP